MKKGDIILVPFPFTDLSSQKTRPALILAGVKGGEDFIVAAITSKKTTPSIKIDVDDIEKGALPVVSYVRYDKIVTLHTSLVKRAVAHLKTSTFKKITKKLKALF